MTDLDLAAYRADLRHFVVLALSDRRREVLVLHDMGGASHAEVVKALGIAEGNVLHRARAALRERLGHHCQLDLGHDAVPCTLRDGGAP